MIESFRPRVGIVADEYFQSFRGDVDLISELLTPLPARIVGAILGSAESDIPNLIRWAHAINGLYERGGRIGEVQAIRAESLLEEMRSFVMKLVKKRRENFSKGTLDPNRDILSGLVSAEIDGDRLTEQELLSTMVTLFVAGHETTTHLLGNGLFAVLSRPSIMEDLRNDHTLVPQTVEEMARFDGSVPRSWRIAKRDLIISGSEIKAGEMVLPLLAAANRDPAVFSNPNEFDLHRDTRAAYFQPTPTRIEEGLSMGYDLCLRPSAGGTRIAVIPKRLELVGIDAIF